MSEPRPRWFAVDRDGLVGRFRPDAEGTIPAQAVAPARAERVQVAIDVARVLRRLLDGSISRARPGALATDRMLVVLRDDAADGPRYRGAARTPRTVDALLAPFSPTVWRDDGQRAVLTDAEVDVPTIIALAQHADVQHLIGLRDVEETAAALDPRNTLYELRHEPGPQGGMRYRRTSVPRGRPLHESELPERERAALVAVRAPLAFASSERVDAATLELHDLPEEEEHDDARGADPVDRDGAWMRWLIGSIAIGVVLRMLAVFFE